MNFNHESLRKELEDAFDEGSHCSGNRDQWITTRLAALDDGDDGVGNWVKASDRLPGIGTYYVKRISTGEKMVSRVTSGGMHLSVIYREPENILWLNDIL